MIAKDGIPIIIVTGIIVLVCAVIAVFFNLLIFQVLTLLFAGLFIFHFFFFRDPDRVSPDGNNLVISPADGTIIKIEKVFENNYFKEDAYLVSVFMSVFNVHVNRIPISGTVDYLKYSEGKFLAAFADDACEQNEQSVIGIKSEKGKILFKQIAGLIARRIVYHIKESDKVNSGDRFGLIRYGSRIDIYLPVSAKINVKLKDKVRSGKTIIGEL